MKMLLVLNDPPYGTERSYNALRLGGALSKQPNAQVRVFLIGEGAACAHAHQKVPQGHYSIEIMLKSILKHGGEIGSAPRAWTRAAYSGTQAVGVGAAEFGSRDFRGRCGSGCSSHCSRMEDVGA